MACKLCGSEEAVAGAEAIHHGCGHVAGVGEVENLHPTIKRAPGYLMDAQPTGLSLSTSRANVGQACAARLA